MTTSKPKSIKNPEGIRFLEASETYNLTHLSPMKEWARNRTLHRDFNSHMFRWQHAAMLLHKMGDRREKAAVLDIACGPDWPQLVTMHSNGCAPAYFLGVDLRDCGKTMPKVGNTKVEFAQCDITSQLPVGAILAVTSSATNLFQPWDMVVCFEVLEHMPKESGIKLLDNIWSITADNTLVLFSTPCFDEKVGMAENHVYEWGYAELREELEKRFHIEDHFGTFASLKDYTPSMSEAELKVLTRLKQYYNSAIVANLMAPLYPDKARNVLWHLKKKKQ